jgi:hypothetical protein
MAGSEPDEAYHSAASGLCIIAALGYRGPARVEKPAEGHAGSEAEKGPEEQKARAKFRRRCFTRIAETTMAATKRTTHRSSKGTKLYAVRDKKGRFKDIQTYKRAHSADLRKKSKKEKAKA